MTAATDLLKQLEAGGVHLYLAEGRLRALASKEALTPGVREQIAGHRDELMALLRDGGLDEGPQASVIEPADRSQVLPLSFAQQRLWFLWQLDPTSVEYNLPIPIKWDEEFDLTAMTSALTALVERHEVLRTRLVDGPDDTPCQVIDPPAPFELPVRDVSGAADPEVEIQAALRREMTTPFDLSTGPVIRAELLRVTDTQHVLVLCLHHVAFDEWSARILQREINELYQAFRDHRPARLPVLPVQYADFAAWQRQWLSGEVLDEQLEYWRKRLAGAPVLELPTDRPRPPVRSTQGRSLEFEVPAEVTARLQALARTSGASMFMTLFSAFAVLLSRYSGQTDVMVGTPIANRNRAETEGLIGFFVNTLVLRADLDGNPSFTELLGRVRETALEAYAHQDLPFEHLVDALETTRDRSRTPLFQVIFSYAYAQPGGDGPADGGAPPAPEDSTVPVKFDLALSVGETNDGTLRAGIAYATSLFDADRMERLVEHLKVLLAGIAADPDRPVAQLPILSAPERADLARWSVGEGPVPAVTGVHELITARALVAPTAVAIRCGDEVLTYADLEEQATRRARHLRSLGVGPESLVGLCLPRSAQMVVSMVAVWKAGGAYVPLDPNYPSDRLAFMLEDSRAEVLLATTEGLSRLSAELIPPGCQIVLLDDEPRSSDEGELPGCVSGDQAAYVIYTSGSTGRPKGVQIAHGAVVNMALALRDVLGAGEGVTALQFASFSFDAAVLDVAVVLTAGGTLAIATDPERGEPEALAALIERHQVDVASVVPSLLAVLDQPAVSRVRNWVVGAERLTADRARPWTNGSQLWNTYGPTETTVIATAGLLPPTQAGAAHPPIGSPIGNIQVRLLDRALQPVPVGVEGEVYIGGAGVARGYIGRSALTSEKFIADPVAGDGSRLYRSGDTARWRPDGLLEFVGRIDHQVKVRGFRIEPGEIEKVLATHPAVATAVVIADGQEEDRRLVAYAVPASEDALPPVEELRQHIRQQLPEYMVPAVFVPIPELPLGPNGKLDRAALPAPDSARLAPVTVYQAPRDGTEELLASIWAGLLNVERVGVADNFFDLGGHSLLATQVMSRVRSTFDIEIPLAALFDRPTVAGLAEAVREALAAADGAELEGFDL
ncbi:amino acid adenylation domain-containing protein [Kineosporia rhizophila]|uniref:non-ribosomal peptide synthetase n=1 Tax=Kineosporia rhizophila TaxID=84633 RepID=UPI001E4266DC|nr:non-ribosomal peptide synthetase [Kineosporia rhizophila]MCE0537829.1 amino acid adenylation domain-containing protein [Kineosporia rhizophila]